MTNIVRLIIAEDRSITLLQGDITQQDTDAIVNAANSSLMGGGGVDGAIHRAGGPAILEDCKQIVARQGSLPTGHAVATTGGRLKARYVIHTVGPVWHGGDHNEPEQLASCYRESLRVADELALSSVAFPSISTGAYGYPVRESADIALAALAGALRRSAHVRDVRLVLFGNHAMAAHQMAANSLKDPTTGTPYKLEKS